MLKNNKRGFTLVELLAVIVILGVITLIAVTSVIPRMNSARKSAFLDDAKVYFKASDEIDLYNNNTTKCLDISEVDGEYVSKNDDSYSGALYVYPNGDSKLYLTNGKYYAITSGDITTDDIFDTKPANFISSCTDNSKTYTITYDLDGGTLSSANPTSYKFNTDTFTLNNPTKPGYRFVGWSSKNLVEVHDQLISVNNNYYIQTSPMKLLSLKPNTTYVLSFSYKMKKRDGGPYCSVGYGNSTNQFLKDLNHASYPSPDTGRITNKFTTPSTFNYDPPYVGFRFVRTSTIRTNEAYIYNVQLEEGTEATDYQEYMEPTINVKVYRGSTGNKKFIANWEAI